jgi:hypothetical protein
VENDQKVLAHFWELLTMTAGNALVEWNLTGRHGVLLSINNITATPDRDELTER